MTLHSGASGRYGWIFLRVHRESSERGQTIRISGAEPSRVDATGLNHPAGEGIRLQTYRRGRLIFLGASLSGIRKKSAGVPSILERDKLAKATNFRDNDNKPN